MKDLHSTLSSVLVECFTSNAARIHELAAGIPEQHFWKKPYVYGNSFGHLVLHLTGNLNYYIGAQIARTGYIRDRPKEFNDPNPPSKQESLRHLDDAIAMVTRTLHSQTADDWAAPYSAVGSACANRLAMIFQCAAHMQHHIGQMIYLNAEWNRIDSK